MASHDFYFMDWDDQGRVYLRKGSHMNFDNCSVHQGLGNILVVERTFDSTFPDDKLKNIFIDTLSIFGFEYHSQRESIQFDSSILCGFITYRDGRPAGQLTVRQEDSGRPSLNPEKRLSFELSVDDTKVGKATIYLIDTVLANIKAQLNV